MMETLHVGAFSTCVRQPDRHVHYEVVAILRGVEYMRKPEDADIVADALRIGETAVQLIGYRDEFARFEDDGGRVVDRVTGREWGAR